MYLFKKLYDLYYYTKTFRNFSSSNKKVLEVDLISLAYVFLWLHSGPSFIIYGQIVIFARLWFVRAIIENSGFAKAHVQKKELNKN